MLTANINNGGNSQVSIARLVIYPLELHYVPDDRRILANALSEIEFIGEQLPVADPAIAPTINNGQRFLIGDQFLNFVTFMGCSPAIEIEPPDNGSEDFCHVVISPAHDKTEFCADAAGKGPRCPHCRHEEQDWQTLAKQYQDDTALEYACPQCQQITPLLNLNWRKSAVAARIFISIYSVFPNEAVLADKVLQVLEQATGARWRYFYSR